MNKLLSTLKSAGLKVTESRRVLLDILEQHSIPMSAEEIHAEMARRAQIHDLVTVYRNMETLVNAGLITAINFDDGRQRFELNSHHHHHLVCTHCGHIEVVDECALEAVNRQLTQQTGYTHVRHSLEFFGLCAHCS